MNGMKIVCMRVEHLVFLYSISFLRFALRKLSEALRITVEKSWYHYFDTQANLDYVWKIPGLSYYGLNEMSESERSEFLACHEGQKFEVFDNRRVLEFYCQCEICFLREACQVLRRESIQIVNINVFIECITIGSACNMLLRKRFLKPDTIGLITSGGYPCNINYSNKAMMWLVYRELTDACTILHARNGRDFRPPELPNPSVDSFCPETETVYEFLRCFYHGDTCQPFRDITTLRGNILAERYEKKMARLQQLTSVVYTVEVVWVCQFDRDILPHHPELLQHPVVQSCPLITRDALYGCRTESIIRSVRGRRFTIMT